MNNDLKNAMEKTDGQIRREEKIKFMVNYIDQLKAHAEDAITNGIFDDIEDHNLALEILVDNFITEQEGE
jgi:hypothetical protein